MSKAITNEGQLIDVFTAAALSKPDISILSDQFLVEVRGLTHKNVAAELLERLPRDELRARSRHNLVRDDRLDDAGKCASENQGDGEADTEEAWVSAGSSQ